MFSQSCGGKIILRAETVFHLLQVVILAYDHGKAENIIVSLPRKIFESVSLPALNRIGRVREDNRRGQILGRLAEYALCSAIYPFLPKRSSYFGPILNRPLSLLLASGGAKEIILLNDGRYSDGGLVKNRPNPIYRPNCLNSINPYSLNVRNRNFKRLVVTENSNLNDFARKYSEDALMMEIMLRIRGDSDLAKLLLTVFSPQLPQGVESYENLVVLNFVDSFENRHLKALIDFASQRHLCLEKTLFRLHPRTKSQVAERTVFENRINLDCGVYPIEILFGLVAKFKKCFFVDTSASVLDLSEETFRITKILQ